MDTAPPCLVLLCKRPALGHAKQRLAGTLGQEAALSVAQALLACALEDLRQWRGQQIRRLLLARVPKSQEKGPRPLDRVVSP